MPYPGSIPPPLPPLAIFSSQRVENLTIRDFYALEIMKVLLEKYDSELPINLAQEAFDHADALISAR